MIRFCCLALSLIRMRSIITTTTIVLFVIAMQFADTLASHRIVVTSARRVSHVKSIM